MRALRIVRQTQNYNLMSLFRQGVPRDDVISGKSNVQHALKTLAISFLQKQATLQKTVAKRALT